MKVRCIQILFLLVAFVPHAFAKKLPKCETELIGSLPVAQQRVKDNLGWLPAKRWTTNVSPPWDLKFFEPGVSKGKENQIASSSFTVKGDVLEMSWTETEKKYRNRGLSELLLAEILTAYPSVRKIVIGDLQATNLKLFTKAAKKMGRKDAFRKTYAYMKYARLGFGKVVDVEIYKGKYFRTTFGSRKYSLVVEEPYIRIILEWGRSG